MGEGLILIVDDQIESSVFLANDVLEPNGYRALMAKPNLEEIERTLVRAPDLAVLRFREPGTWVSCMLDALQKRKPSLPVLLVAPPGMEAFVLQMLHAGADGYLISPLVGDEFIATIERTLEGNRLRWERDRLSEQVQRQAEAYRVLSSIGQKLMLQTDRQQMLNQVVETAAYVVGADESSLHLVDRGSDALRQVAYCGPGDKCTRPASRVHWDRLALRVLDSRTPLMLSGPSAAAAGAPAPAVLAVPLCTREGALGVLGVSRAEKGAGFAQSHLHQLSVLAQLVAMIVENADLRTEMQDDIERTAILQIGASFGSTLRLESVLDMVMHVAIRLVDAERGLIVLLDEQGSGYVPRTAYAVDAQAFGAPEFSPEREAIRQVMKENRPVRTSIESVSLEDRSTLERRAAMCIPIAGAGGVIGAIYVDRRGGLKRFQKYHEEMLTALAGNAAVPIENARLFNQVEAERRKLEAVLRGTDQPVIVADAEKRIVLMNTAARRFLGKHQARGTGLLFQQAIDHPELSYLIDQAEASGQVQYGEIATAGGEIFRATVTPVSGIGFVAVMQDITDFAELSRMKSEFVATVSHDLRSPLSTVLGFLSVLGQAGSLNEQQQDFVGCAQQEVNHLLDLTSDLLDLGRLEADIDLEMTRCDIDHVVRKSLEHAQGLCCQREQTIESDLPSRPLYVRGNAGLLRQAVDNLVGNAIKYTLPDGWVHVCLAQEGQEVVLRVKDSGIGIAPEDQPHIFDRFFRGHSSEVRSVEGTGLGLAIVKSIVERHGGRVWFESELGQGSTFGVVLPATNELDQAS